MAGHAGAHRVPGNRFYCIHFLGYLLQIFFFLILFLFTVHYKTIETLHALKSNNLQTNQFVSEYVYILIFDMESTGYGIVFLVQRKGRLRKKVHTHSGICLRHTSSTMLFVNDFHHIYEHDCSFWQYKLLTNLEKFFANFIIVFNNKLSIRYPLIL